MRPQTKRSARLPAGKAQHECSFSLINCRALTPFHVDAVTFSRKNRQRLSRNERPRLSDGKHATIEPAHLLLLHVQAGADRFERVPLAYLVQHAPPSTVSLGFSSASGDPCTRFAGGGFLYAPHSIRSSTSTQGKDLSWVEEAGLSNREMFPIPNPDLLGGRTVQFSDSLYRVALAHNMVHNAVLGLPRGATGAVTRAIVGGFCSKRQGISRLLDALIGSLQRAQKRSTVEVGHHVTFV